MVRFPAVNRVDRGAVSVARSDGFHIVRVHTQLTGCRGSQLSAHTHTLETVSVGLAAGAQNA